LLESPITNRLFTGNAMRIFHPIKSLCRSFFNYHGKQGQIPPSPLHLTSSGQAFSKGGTTLTMPCKFLLGCFSGGGSFKDRMPKLELGNEQTSVNLKLAILAFVAGLTSAQAADPPNSTSGVAMPDHANRKVIIQEGKDNSKSVTQTGEDNDLELRQKGDRNEAEIRQEGNANTLKVQQEAQDNHAKVNQQGSHNQVNIEQKGHGNRAVVRQNSP